MNSEYEKLDRTLNILHEIHYFIPYLKEGNKSIESIKFINNEALKLKKLLLKETNAPLIALKAYTEGKCSWEKAGMISNLYIFGLEQYCKDHNTNRADLRIDEYYGITGESGICTIMNAWEQLDPSKTMYPINFSGNSNYTKYSIIDNSENEKRIGKAEELYYTKKAQSLIAEFHYKYQQSWSKLIKNNPNEEEEANWFNASNRDFDFLLKLTKGLIVKNKEQLDYFKFILDLSYLFIKSAVKGGNFYLLLSSVDKIRNVVQDNYYDYTVKKDKLEEYLIKNNGKLFPQME